MSKRPSQRPTVPAPPSPELLAACLRPDRRMPEGAATLAALAVVRDAVLADVDAGWVDVDLTELASPSYEAAVTAADLRPGLAARLADEAERSPGRDWCAW